MCDRVPQLRMLSTNDCPNSGPRTFDGTDCVPGWLTTWGYCSRCWADPDLYVPLIWQERCASRYRQEREVLLNG